MQKLPLRVILITLGVLVISAALGYLVGQGLYTIFN